MKIVSAKFMRSGDSAVVTLDDGAECIINTKLPPDEPYRCMLSDWLTAGGGIAPYAAPPLTIDDYRHAIQAHIDATAQAQSYDSGVTCSSYVGSTNPAWAAEAAAFVAWRDAVWTYAYSELEKVQAGQRPQPSVAAILDELPAMTWPG